MKVKDLIQILKHFKNAELTIDSKAITFEAYETSEGKLIFNIKFLNEK